MLIGQKIGVTGSLNVPLLVPYAPLNALSYVAIAASAVPQRVSMYAPHICGRIQIHAEFSKYMSKNNTLDIQDAQP